MDKRSSILLLTILLVFLSNFAQGAVLSDLNTSKISYEKETNAKLIGNNKFNIPIKVLINNEVYENLVYLDSGMNFRLSSSKDAQSISAILDYINSNDFQLSFRFDCSEYDSIDVCKNYTKLSFAFDFSTATLSIIMKARGKEVNTSSLTRINNDITYNQYNNNYSGNYNGDIRHGLSDNVYLGVDLRYSWTSESVNSAELTNLYISQIYNDIDLKYSYQRGYNNRYYVDKSSDNNYLTLEVSKDDSKFSQSDDRTEVIEYSNESGSINVLSSDGVIKVTQPLIRGYNSIVLDSRVVGTNTAIVQLVVDGEIIKETNYAIGSSNEGNRKLLSFSLSENLDELLLFGNFSYNELDYQFSYSTLGNYFLNRLQYHFLDFNTSYQYIYSDDQKNRSEYSLDYKKRFGISSIGASYFYSEGEVTDNKSINLYYNTKIAKEYNFTMSYQKNFNTSEYRNLNISLSGALPGYKTWNWTLTADNNFVTNDRNVFLSLAYYGKSSSLINPTMRYAYGNNRGNELELRNKMEFNENESLDLGVSYEEQSQRIKSDASLYVSNDWFNSNIFANRGQGSGYGFSLSNSFYAGKGQVWSDSQQYDNYALLDEYSVNNTQINYASPLNDKVGFDQYITVSTDEQKMKELENQSGKVSRFRMISISAPKELKNNYIVYGRVIDQRSKGFGGVDVINHSSSVISDENGYFAMVVSRNNPTIKLMKDKRCGEYNIQDYVDKNQSVVILGRLQCER